MRQLEALVRLSEALARLRCTEKITPTYVREVCSVLFLPSKCLSPLMSKTFSLRSLGSGQAFNLHPASAHSLMTLAGEFGYGFCPGCNVHTFCACLFGPHKCCAASAEKMLVHVPHISMPLVS